MIIMTDSKELKKYRAWVKKEGHLTASASSVLGEYAIQHRLSEKEYNELEEELGFREPLYGYPKQTIEKLLRI
jgi:hypothetical protein